VQAPFFSIISAVYNAEGVVESTAASLRNQTFREFEWIVVDGGSSDGTLDVIRPFLVDGRDTVISEPDRGVYDAMNKGLRQAKGKVVQFLNAGDRFASEDVLEEVAAEFGDDVDALYGDTVLELANGLTVFKPALNLETCRYRRIPFSHQSLFTRRELHLLHPFDLTYTIAADYAAIAAMHRAGVRMKRLRKTLNVNTVEPDAISKSGQVLAAAEDCRVHKEILGRSSIEASAFYLCKRVSLLGGDLLRSLPPPFYARLPEAIRRRVY
jgi:glycosyltransferase involved in cell wall biosynthesis